MDGLCDGSLMFPNSPICDGCRNIESWMKRTCAAYPAGIPEEIWSGEVDHRQPHDGDRGITFVAANDDWKQRVASHFARRLVKTA